MERLGTGIGWRPEIAADIARLPGIDWVEVVAENVCPDHLPDALCALRDRGTTIVPHGVSLGLGDAARPDTARLSALAARAEALGAPLVTEHIAFVRGGGPLTASQQIEAGHLLPVPRTREALDVLCENVRIAQDALPVPLALENIAALISWPGEELTEGQFLTELVERTGVRLLIDVANIHTNHVNRGEDPAATLDALPVEAIAYVHVAGGVERDGVWHDSHAHPVTEPVLDVLADLCARVTPPGVLLERDDAFPPVAELAAELDAIRAVLARAPERATARPAAAPPAQCPTSAPPAGRPGVPYDRVGASTAFACTPPAGGPPRTATVPAPRPPAADGPRRVRRPATAGHGARSTGRAGAPLPAAAAATAPAAGPAPSAPVGAAGVTAVPERPAGPVRRSAAPTAPAASATSPAAPAASPAALGQGRQRPVTRRAGAEGAPGADGRDAVRAGGQHPTGVRDVDEVVRQRLALAQTALLSALVAGTPAPEGFDRARLRVQSRALIAKRADVVAAVAPELPAILGTGYRPAFVAYARQHPLTRGYRRDALAFVEQLLVADEFADPAVRRRLTDWWRERSGPAPPPPHPAARLLRAARRVWRRK